jgi:hypothetical protein
MRHPAAELPVDQPPPRVYSLLLMKGKPFELRRTYFHFYGPAVSNCGAYQGASFAICLAAYFETPN